MSSPHGALSAAARRWPRERYALLLVCVAVLLVYGQLVDAPPLIWDDDLNIFENPFYAGGTWWKLWLEPHFGMYIPVTSSVWAALYYAADGAAWPFRLLNIALHLANVGLVAMLAAAWLRRSGRTSAAAVTLAAAIFALHPEQTAVVSWISGGRDLLASLFGFAAFAVYVSGRGRSRIAIATVLFAAALLSKPSAAAIPVVLVAYACLFDRERTRPTIATALLWTALALIVIQVTRAAQSGMFTVQVPLTHRPLIALDALGFYVIKSVWPFPLAADYGRTPDFVWSHPTRAVPTLIVLCLFAAALRRAVRRKPDLRIAYLWPLVFLPILGLVTFPYQRISTVADHYNYLGIAIFAVTAAALVASSARWSGPRAWTLVTAVVVMGSAASYVRARDWRDNERFFSDMLEKNPRSFSAVINIAAVQCDLGNWRVGLATLRAAPGLLRSDAAYLANETYCLFRAGRFPEVFARQERLADPTVIASLEANAGAAAILANSLAGAFIAKDRPLSAFAYLCQAAALSPSDPDIARNLEAARATLRERGREVTCRGKLRWELLRQIVQVLN